MPKPTLKGYNTYLIPLSNNPQNFDISLAGVNYTIVCRWNNSDDSGWVIDFIDQVSQVPIVANVPLITGLDCLSGLDYLGIDGQLIVYTDGNDFAVPTLDNLGVESNLYFLTTAATNG